MHSTAVTSPNAPETMISGMSSPSRRSTSSASMPFHWGQVVVGEHYFGIVLANLPFKLGFLLHYHHGNREAAFAQSHGHQFRVHFVIFDVQHTELARLGRDIVSGGHQPRPPNAWEPSITGG